MQLLVRPDPFQDESLESYLLRLAEANRLESYRLLSDSIKAWLMEHDHDAAGAFPLELSRVNVCHAREASSMRVRALKLVEKLTSNHDLPLLRLSLLHSNTRFCGDHSAVYRDGVEIPRSFLRRDNIPVCPACLAESGYIQQSWHLKPYQACVVHECRLIHSCPLCNRTLSYVRDEVLLRCTCGFSLSEALLEQATAAELEISRLVSGHTFDSDNPLLNSTSLSLRFGAIYWYLLRYQPEFANENESYASAIEYFENWPNCLTQELSVIEDSSDEYLVQAFNKTAFKHLFGDLLWISRRLPSTHPAKNFVLAEVIAFLRGLVDRHPKGKNSNVADVLLTVSEAATLLVTTHEQVYRLYQEGSLELAFMPPLHQKLSVYQPAFYLRQVVELSLARVAAEEVGYANYVPAW